MRNGDLIFDPRAYAKVRLPLLEAETLPPWCYTSEVFYAREVERIFRKVWNFIGRADHMPDPGDYTAFDFVGVPVIVVRGRDGVVRAFANSCRHRGTQIVCGEGNCRAFKCPYHSWTYSLDGELLSAPEMHRTERFDTSEYGLVPIRLETWAGFLFINFDPSAASLAEYLGDLPARMAPYDLQEMVCVRRKEFDIACNWKLFVENAKESYHIGTVHRKTINQYASAETSRYDVEPANGQYVITFAQHKGSMALLKGDPGFPKIETLTGKEAEGTYAPLVYPSTYFGCTIDTVWYLDVRPLGPRRMKLVHGACFPKTVAARPDFAEIAGSYYKRWDITIEEDIVACESQQKGVESPFCRPGRFCYREPLVHEIDNWVLDRVIGPPSAAARA